MPSAKNWETREQETSFSNWDVVAEQGFTNKASPYCIRIDMLRFDEEIKKAGVALLMNLGLRRSQTVTTRTRFRGR